jgi:hypothetical protein
MSGIVPFYPGTTVRHLDLGKGIVVSCSRSHVTVDFERQGVKRIDLLIEASRIWDPTHPPPSAEPGISAKQERAATGPKASPKPAPAIRPKRERASSATPREEAEIARIRSSMDQPAFRCSWCGEVFLNALVFETHRRRGCSESRVPKGGDLRFYQGGLPSLGKQN